MSERKVYIRFLEADVTGIISLYEDVAPKTCDAIWGALHQPIQWPALHAAFTGPEIMMGLPESAQTFDPRSLGPENITSFPAAGELLWFYQPKNYFKMDPGRVLGNRPGLWRGRSYGGPRRLDRPELLGQGHRELRCRGRAVPCDPPQGRAHGRAGPGEMSRGREPQPAHPNRTPVAHSLFRKHEQRESS